MFFEETPALLLWRNSVRIMGIRTTGPAVKNHISSEMAREVIATYPIMYHVWFLDSHRVFPHFLLHLLLLHLLHRSQHRRTEKTENLGDLITADHKILSEESEPRNNHRYAVVVQDLPMQRSQSCPCGTKTSGADEETKSHSH